ncbi:MAG: hypothetical protein ACYS8W_13605 [Planctomycetota bacterium]|jgi:hypothetical protein
MKLSLPFKLGILVVVIFGLTIAACLLWTPLRVKYYTAMLKSDNPDEIVRGVDGLLETGKASRQAIAETLDLGEPAADFLSRFWELADNGMTREEFLKAGAFTQEVGYGLFVRMLANDDEFTVQMRNILGENTLFAGKAGRAGRFCYPIHLAAASGDSALTRLFIYRTENINCLLAESFTPLDIAAFNDKDETARLLASHGGKMYEELHPQQEKK